MTKTLLASGVIAGPLFVIVAVAQMIVRPGFDMLRHPVSLLSNGDFGAVQIADFILTGSHVAERSPWDRCGAGARSVTGTEARTAGAAELDRTTRRRVGKGHRLGNTAR